MPTRHRAPAPVLPRVRAASAGCVLLAAGFLSAPVRAAPDGEPGATALEYRVRPGDTLIRIASDRLDETGRWVDVARLNEVPVPRHLQPGTVLRFLPQWLKSAPSEGRVETVGGNARVDGSAARSGATVAEGSLIETGSDGIAVIRLADGTQLRIPPASRVRIDRLRTFHAEDAIEARMKLEHGAIEPVSPPNRRRPLDVQTPAGNAAVRGTDFRVRTDGRTDFVEVLAGQVDAGGSSGRADVDGGLGAAFGSDRAPRLERLLPPPDFDNLANRVFTDTRPVIELPRVSRAQAYQVDVSRDLAFTQLLLSTRVDLPEIAIATRDDGPLYVRMRGISELGLDGRDAVTRIDVQARPIAPRPLSPGANDSRVAGEIELRWQDTGHGGQYRVQLADDARFERLLAEVVVTGDSARLTLPPGATARRFWRIAAIEGRGSDAVPPRQGPFSAVQSFLQRAPAPVERIRTLPNLRDGDGLPSGIGSGEVRTLD